MGVLQMSYGKQMAGQLVRSLQFRMHNVQRRVRNIARQIEQRTKYWDNLIKSNKNQMMSEMAFAMQGLAKDMNSSIFAGMTIKDKSGNAVDLNNIMNIDWQTLDPETAKQLNTRMTMANQQNTYTIQAMQQSLQQTLAMNEQVIEAQKDAEISALKDEEDSIMTEKESLETQIQLAQNDYEAYKKSESAEIKNFTPMYTGQA